MDWWPHIVCAGLGFLVTLAMIPLLRRWSAPLAVGGNGTGFHHTHKAPISRLEARSKRWRGAHGLQPDGVMLLEFGKDWEDMSGRVFERTSELAGGSVG